MAVFDPQGLAGAPALLPSLRWSPVRGCERPQTAMLRAAALVADAGRSGVENGTFWRQQTLSAVRCLLHAAALDGRPPADLYRWSHSAASAKEAVAILAHDAGRHPGLGLGRSTPSSCADQRTRDSVWAMVANTFAAAGRPGRAGRGHPGRGRGVRPGAVPAPSGTPVPVGHGLGGVRDRHPGRGAGRGRRSTRPTLGGRLAGRTAGPAAGA